MNFVNLKLGFKGVFVEVGGGGIKFRANAIEYRKKTTKKWEKFVKISISLGEGVNKFRGNGCATIHKFRSRPNYALRLAARARFTSKFDGQIYDLIVNIKRLLNPN